MKRPLIGVTPGYAGPSSERNFCRTAEIVYSDLNYLRRVAEAGGIPVLMSHTNDTETLRGLASRLDGLLFTGGEDVHPNHYGQDVQVGTDINDARDQFELQLFQEFVKTRKPILAICRGFQVINVALGGTLIQDLGMQAGATHHVQQAPTAVPTHEVRLDEGCRLARMFGETNLEVNSHHHQAIDLPAESLKVVGWSEEGIPEALEHKNHPYLLGVQWHPERLASRAEIQQKLFADFVAAAAAMADGRTRTG